MTSMTPFGRIMKADGKFILGNELNLIALVTAGFAAQTRNEVETANQIWRWLFRRERVARRQNNWKVNEFFFFSQERSSNSTNYTAIEMQAYSDPLCFVAIKKYPTISLCCPASVLLLDWERNAFLLLSKNSPNLQNEKLQYSEFNGTVKDQLKQHGFDLDRA